jgi:hypothetical protein
MSRVVGSARLVWIDDNFIRGLLQKGGFLRFRSVRRIMRLSTVVDVREQIPWYHSPIAIANPKIVND